MKPGSVWASAVLLAVVVGGCDDPKPAPGKGAPTIAIEPLPTTLPRKPNDFPQLRGEGGPGVQGGKDGADCPCDEDYQRQMLDGVYDVVNGDSTNPVGRVLVDSRLEHWVLWTPFRADAKTPISVTPGEKVSLPEFQKQVCAEHAEARYFIVSDQPRTVPRATAGDLLGPEPVSAQGAFVENGRYDLLVEGEVQGAVLVVRNVEHWIVNEHVELPSKLGFKFVLKNTDTVDLRVVERLAKEADGGVNQYRVVASMPGDLKCSEKHP